MVCFHSGYLWMGKNIPIVVDLISYIVGLPKAGVNLSQYFRGKDNDKKLATKMQNKYGVVKDKRAYVIDTIKWQIIIIATKLMTVKIVQKK